MPARHDSTLGSPLNQINLFPTPHFVDFRHSWEGVTDRQTDGRTDRPSFRDPWTHLKICMCPVPYGHQSNCFEVSFDIPRENLSLIDYPQAIVTKRRFAIIGHHEIAAAWENAENNAFSALIRFPMRLLSSTHRVTGGWEEEGKFAPEKKLGCTIS